MAEKKLSELSQEELVKLAEHQQSVIAAKDKEIADLKAASASKDKELVDIKAQVVAKDKALAAKQKELDGANNVNAQYLEQLSKAPAVAPVVDAKKEVSISSETFKVDGVTYGFKKKAVSEGGAIISAVEVLGSEDLQKKLVAKKSGMIYSIEAE